MDTIVELFDKEPLENVLSLLIYRPRHITMIGDRKHVTEEKRQAILRLIQKKELKTTVNFYYVDTSNVEEIWDIFLKTKENFPDLAFDFTGGKDLLLLLGGLFCKEYQIPGYYIDLTKQRFVGLFHAEEYQKKFQMPPFTISDILTIAGGSVEGHGHFVPETMDDEMIEDILAIWEIARKDLSRFSKSVSYFQQVAKQDGPIKAKTTIRVNDSLTVKASKDILEELYRLDILRNLAFTEGHVSFRFKNNTLKNYLTNQGIWLELFVFVTAKKLRYFDEADTSVILDWDGIRKNRANTKNEIDILLLKGPMPIFISCKSGLPSSLDLSEIKLLSQKFGGERAKAVLVTASDLINDHYGLYQRAKDLKVAVIDKRDIDKNQVGIQLKRIADHEFQYLV